MTAKPKKGALIKCYLNNILSFVLCLLSWAVLIPAIPAILAGLLPLYLWKKLVLLSVRLWRKDLIEDLKFHDMVFALDKFYTRPYASTAKVFVLEGQASLDTIRGNFIQRILNKEIPRVSESENTRWEFQRLRQIPVGFGLFYFWKELANINADLHFRKVKLFDHSRYVGKSDLCVFLSELMTQPFPAGSALWEVVLVGNFEEDKSVVIFRIHHILADGYTLNHIVDEMMGTKSLYTVKEDSFSRKQKLQLLWKAPAWSIKLCVEELLMPANWTSLPKKSLDGALYMTEIPLETLKLIRKQAGCHFATIGLCVLAGALRRLFLESHDKRELPNYIKIMHFLPKPAHPMDRMCNHWRVGCFQIMTATPSALKRLEMAEAFFKDYTENHYFRAIDFQCQLAGLVPAPLYTLFLKRNYSTSMAFTSLPGYHGPAQLWGHRILDIYKICGLQYQQTALGAASYSHNGSIAFSVFANRDIVPTVEIAKRLTDVYLHDELKQLIAELQVDSNQV